MSLTRGTKLVLDIVQAGQNVISGSGATRTLNANESGSVCLFDRAAGIIFTLPTAKVGTYYDFHVTTSITSNNAKIITAVGTELVIGGISLNAAALAVFSGNGSTHLAVTMNGTTTGGLLGTKLRFTCLSSTRWMVEGTALGSGTGVTPFATS